MIIKDASRDITVSLKHVLQNFSLRSGDIIKLLGIIHAFRKDRKFYSKLCISFSKRETKLHSSATINKHKENILEEVQKSIDEYSTCAEVEELKKLADNLQVQFEIAVEVGKLREVAIEYAKNFQATHVILPRQLKEELKYFTENLACQISRIRQGNSIEIIKAPHQVAEFGTPSSGTGQETTSNQENCKRQKQTLNMERRMTIAYGAAKGLEHLHRESIYGSIRPSSIFLTHNYKPLTFEHLAPEYGKAGIDLSKADVFSFGVVLLELITGRKSLEDTDGERFLRWGRPLLRQRKYMELIDPMLQDSVDVFQLYWMVHLTEKCVSWDPNHQYSIKKVAADLGGVVNGDGVEDFSPTESELVT